MARPTGMPAVEALRTPPVKQGAIIQRRAAGQSKRQIARELGVDRDTVTRVEQAHFQTPPDASIVAQSKALIPKALESLDRHIPEDGGLAMRYLESTLFRETGRGNVTFNDARLNVAIGMLPDARPPLTVGDAHARALPNPEVTSDTPNPASASVAQVGIEAAEKDGRATDTITSHPNFFLTFTFWDGA